MIQKKMDKNEYRHLDKKVRHIQNQLEVILSSPRNPETTQSDQLLVEELHKNLHFLNTLLSTEIAVSDKCWHLAKMARRVIRLQKAAHAWTEGRHFTPSVESSGFSPGLLIESLDYKEEVSGVAGVKVYENPLFIGFPDDGYIHKDDINDRDYDDNSIIDKVQVEEVEVNEEEDVPAVADQDEVHEPEAVIEGLEKEVIRVDYQKEENKGECEEEEDDDDNEEEEEGCKNSCYKIIFWGLFIVMGAISVVVGFSDFPDDHASVILLTPT